ncbi:MAG: preprotein translocase subunit SecG [Patescibacteria group bacterium]|nr:preprotein translocase subunit SecG [Patescibacteria group bacterium]
MKTIILALQIILSIALIGLIIIQSKGVGLSGPFGGRLGTYSTKRGVEKAVSNLTIIVAVLFFFSSLAQLWIK